MREHHRSSESESSRSDPDVVFAEGSLANGVRCAGLGASWRLAILDACRNNPLMAAVCLAGALAVPLSAQNAVADLQRLEAADVDASPDGPAERRVCLNRSAYVLAVQGVLRGVTFEGEGRVIWEEEPGEWVALQVDPDGDGDNWQIFHVEEPGCFTVRATMARVRIYLLRVGVDWDDFSRVEWFP